MSSPMTCAHDTWLAPEEHAYPNGGQTRKGLAIYPDGKLRRVWAGIPDTFFSIPAHGRLHGKYVRGWVGIDDRNITCEHCGGENWQSCEHCQFGLVDSPTRGALLFHVYERTASTEVTQ